MSEASFSSITSQDEIFDTFSAPPDSEVLIIYTGGTIGMDVKADGSLQPRSGFLKEFMDGMFKMTADDVPLYDILEWQEPVDSSNFSPKLWAKLVQDIHANYDKYCGFVILMGTDTMAFTASAVSFAFENLAKPIIFTGSQIPITRAFTDARRHLTVALLAAAKLEIPEVCLYFNSKLLRGNRSKKLDNWGSSAFESPNCHHLASMGTSVRVSKDHRSMPKKRLKVHTSFSDRIVVVYLVPGFNDEMLLRLVSDDKDADNPCGLVMMLYGTGNAPNHHKQSFLRTLGAMLSKGVEIVIASQCRKGAVSLDTYATGKQLQKLGLINAGDMTIEACVAKLSSLMGRGYRGEKLKKLMETDLRGEMSDMSQHVPYYGFTEDILDTA